MYQTMLKSPPIIARSMEISNNKGMNVAQIVKIVRNKPPRIPL
jgi:hypothetical protein